VYPKGTKIGTGPYLNIFELDRSFYFLIWAATNKTLCIAQIVLDLGRCPEARFLNGGAGEYLRSTEVGDGVGAPGFCGIVLAVR
jgi:hypothetical protein